MDNHPVITFNGWQCIPHYNKDGDPVWFSYYVWAYYSSLSRQMAKDLSTYFSKQVEIYDIFGAEGVGTARIKIIS